MRSFILLLCLIPTIICAQNFSLEDQLKQAIKGKKAEIGIAVIIDGKDTVTVNNDIHYPLMSVFKFHQALALADYMGKQQQSLNFELTIKKEDLKPDTYSPLRDSFPQGGFNIDIADLLKYTLQQSDNNACDILFQYQGGVDAVNQYIHSLGVPTAPLSAQKTKCIRTKVCVIKTGLRLWLPPDSWKYSVKKHYSRKNTKTSSIRP